jgi:hypothetical protein
VLARGDDRLSKPHGRCCVSWQLFIPIVAVIATAAFPLAIVLHNVLSAFIGGEEAVSFVIALLVAPGFIAAGTLGVALTLSRDARFRSLAALRRLRRVVQTAVRRFAVGPVRDRHERDSRAHQDERRGQRQDRRVHRPKAAERCRA